MRLLPSALLLGLAAAPLTVAAPGYAGPAVGDAVPQVTPEPRQVIQHSDGFALPATVGLVRGPDSDADSERVARAVLTSAGVTDIRTSADGTDPGTHVTVWLGDGPLADLGVAPAAGLPAEGYVLAAGAKDDRRQIVLDGVDTDGMFYAAQTFGQLVANRHVPGVEVRDWPTMRYRGSIEGFYGTPWSHT